MFLMADIVRSHFILNTFVTLCHVSPLSSLSLFSSGPVVSVVSMVILLAWLSLWSLFLVLLVLLVYLQSVVLWVSLLRRFLGFC